MTVNGKPVDPSEFKGMMGGFGDMPGFGGGMKGFGDDFDDFDKKFEDMKKRMNSGGGGGCPLQQRQRQQSPEIEPEKVPLGLTALIRDAKHLKAVLKGNQGVVVDFWAERCPPCRRLKPHVLEWAEENENPDLAYALVDCDNCGDATIGQGVSRIPALKFFCNGELVSSHTGGDF